MCRWGRNLNQAEAQSRLGLNELLELKRALPKLELTRSAQGPDRTEVSAAHQAKAGRNTLQQTTMLQDGLDAPKRVFWVGCDNEQVNFLGVCVVPVQSRRTAKRLLQVALNCRNRRLVLQRLSPEFNYELVVHFEL